MQPRRESDHEAILVLAPIGRDAALACEMLTQAGLACAACINLQALCDRIPEGAGAVLITEEAVLSPSTGRLLQLLEKQPAWSDLPFVLLAKRRGLSSAGASTARQLTERSTVTVLERPLHPNALITVLQTALRTRRRQYEIRDLLAQQEEVIVRETGLRSQSEQARDELQASNVLLEQRAAERTQQIRTLASRLTLAEQRERLRISQFMHDDLQQLLYGIKLKLHALERKLDEKHTTRTNQLNELIQQAIDTTRELTADLSPPVLQGKGLETSLEWLAFYAEDVHGLKVDFKHDGPCPVPDDALRVVLFQLARELLFNVVKHAGVDQAQISLTEEDGHIIIQVKDEGAGFDSERIQDQYDSTGGFGLFSVRERLGWLGGRLEVESAPGKGASMTIVAPREPV